MKFIFTCMIALVAATAMGQTTFVTQVKTIPFGYSVFRKSVQLADGKTLVAGDCIVPVEDYETGALLMTKMDDAGRVIVSKSVFNVSFYNYEITSLTATADGGFVIVWGDGNAGLYISKFDSNLEAEWQKKFAAGDYSTLNLAKVCQTKAGGYLLCGGVSDNLASNSAAILIALTETGEVSSTKYFLYRDFVDGYSSNRFVISDAAETKDGNYALLATQGYDYRFHESDSTLLFTIQPDGATLWAQYIKGGETGSTGQAMLYTSDGAFVVTGATAFDYNEEQGEYRYRTFVTKLDAAGELAWSRNVTSPMLYMNYAAGIQEDAKGNYVLAGMGRMNGTEGGEGETFNYFMSVTPNGELAWTRKINVPDGGSRANLLSLTATTDGGYVSCGYDPTLEEAGRGGGQVASVHKYDSAFTPCSDAIDSVGELTEAGSAAKASAEAEAYTYSLDISAGEKMTVGDGGTFLYPCNSVLPVQLLSFAANAAGNAVNVAWTTTNEINTDNFVVERSSNGSVFVPLQKVMAVGKNTGTETYRMTDRSPLPNTSYYRLRQVDKDGSFVYSVVLAVTRAGQNGVQVIPNPVQAVIHLVLQSASSGKATVQVTDITGKTVALKTAALVAGTNTLDVPAASLRKGVYLVKIAQGTLVQTIRVMKE